MRRIADQETEEATIPIQEGDKMQEIDGEETHKGQSGDRGTDEDHERHDLPERARDYVLALRGRGADGRLVDRLREEEEWRQGGS